MKLRFSLVFLLILLAIMPGCSPKTSNGVLCFLFDGVPDCVYKDSSMYVKLPPPMIDSSKLTKPLATTHGPDYKIHDPYEKRTCESCHDNSSANNIVTIAQTNICYKCHTDFQGKYKYVHGPVAGGYCTSCHAPHDSEIAKLMKRKGQDLCMMCHTSEQVAKNTVHASIGSTDCIQCHNPHGGTNRSLLQ